MAVQEQQQREDTQSMFEHLRTFIKQGGPDARADVQFYLCMCLKAEELRQQGWRAVVRGKRHHWVVVIKGKQTQEKPEPRPPGIRYFRANTRRRPPSYSVVIDVERNFCACHHTPAEEEKEGDPQPLQEKDDHRVP